MKKYNALTILAMMTVTIKKKIGLWGFGRVGKSVAQILSAENHTLSVMTKDPLSEDEMALAQRFAMQVYTEQEKEYFFNHNDYILPSPGVDIRGDYPTYKEKWLTELDFFYDHFTKPIIAITGSVGKTTTTSLLDQLVKQYGLNICTGGNIGTPMCDFLTQQNIVHYALLEVSSFQLEYTKRFAPHLAIWTNLAPNHLDRHGTYDDYFNAKYHILAQQTNTDKALVPLSLAHKIKARSPESNLYYTSLKPVLDVLNPHDTLFFVEHNQIKKKIGNAITMLVDLNTLPNITFTENWLMITGALDILGLPLSKLPEYAQTLAIPEHRMEKIVANNIIFYNDSKSTTTISTQTALGRLDGKPVILFVGGLSKGVDRAPFIKELQNKVKYVYCFGKEAETLNGYCATYGINSYAFATLDDAFEACVQQVSEDDCILFSPAGSSYDLFKDFEERGNYFKQLVRKFDSK